MAWLDWIITVFIGSIILMVLVGAFTKPRNKARRDWREYEMRNSSMSDIATGPRGVNRS